MLALAMWLLTVHDADYSKMGQLGLVSILGWTYYVGLTLAVLGFTNELLRTRLRSSWLLLFVIILAVYIFGTASAVEPIASLPDTFRHAGLLEFIYQHGYALPHYVADFSWPGAFSLGAVLTSFAGQANALGFTRWFPLFIELMYLAPLVVISRSIGVGRRAGWLGIATFYVTDWIFQDYFSPQALGYLYLLITVAAVLATWRSKPSTLFSELRSTAHERLLRSQSALRLARLRGRDAVKIRSNKQTLVAVLGPWRLKPTPPLFGSRNNNHGRFVRRRVGALFARFEGHDSAAVLSSTQTLSVLGLLGLIFFALAVSHELTPYALILMLAGCLLARRLGRPELLAVAILITVGWLSLGATDYWLGNLAMIFGGFGQVGSTLSANVSGRVAGSLIHKLAVDTRIIIIVSLYFLAGVGVLRRSTDSRVLEIVAVAPFFLLFVSSYVGEGLMRVVFYALPFTALLAASAIFPQQSGAIRSWMPNFRIARYVRSSRATLWALVFVIVLASAFATTVARGGNDDYESFTKGELAAVNYVYDHVTPGATVGITSPYLPFNQRDVGSVYWVALFTGGGPSIEGIRSALINIHPQYIVLSQSQENWGEIVVGYPRGWENTLFNSLVSKGFHVVASWRTASVLKVDAKKAKTK